eukprot:TRINITY_DN6929_c0_g1_i1.p2 TRINITY_DN6929_c0_g1~~TRINITY_DN6929_c0_g1_i1.p2  ORF type:complete len:190 (-),score=85.25 TRINITY_DN6929_c0_g1_i1:135-704(-)
MCIRDRMKTKEKTQKHALAMQQEGVTDKNKECYEESDPNLRKELCQKAREAQSNLRMATEQEQDGLQVTEGESDDMRDARLQIKKAKKLVKVLTEKLKVVKTKQRTQALATEQISKSKIQKENTGKRNAFLERKQKLVQDQRDSEDTKVLEVKSKQSEIQDLKADMLQRQQVARQNLSLIHISEPTRPY